VLVQFQIFSVHGERQARRAASLLRHGLRDVIKVTPLLDDCDDKVRVIDAFRLENPKFESLADVTKIQNALQVGLNSIFQRPLRKR
jgi:hypothetical protein